eukprot:195881_1
MSTFTSKWLLFEGYVRSISDTNQLLVPICIIELLIEYFTSKHCLMVYSVNFSQRKGKIQFIDSSYCKTITKTIEHSMITDSMVNMNKSIRFASNVCYSFHDQHNGYDSVFTMTTQSFDALLFDTQTGEFKTKLSLPIPAHTVWRINMDFDFLYSHKLQQIMYQSEILQLDVSDIQKLKWTTPIDEKRYAANACFINDDETNIFFMGPKNGPKILHLSDTYGSVKAKFKIDNLKSLPPKRCRFDGVGYGICASENNNRIYLIGGPYEHKRCADYLDLVKNKWFVLSDLKYRHSYPLVWTDSAYMVYVTTKDIRAGEISVIEGFDSRCNQWIDLDKDRQLRETIKIPKSISTYIDQYVASKMFTVSL